MSRARIWVSHWFNTAPEGSWRPWLPCLYRPTLTSEEWDQLRGGDVVVAGGIRYCQGEKPVET